MAWWSRQKQLTSVLTNLKQGLPFKYSVELTARRTCPIVFQERHAAYCHNHMIGSIKPMSNFIPGKVPWSDEFPNSVRNQVHFLSRNHDVNHPLMRSQLWNVKTTMFSTQATKKSIPETNNHSIKGFAFRKVVPASFSGDNKSQTILMYLAAVAVAMMGLTYAAVPLYSKFCQATGYGGTVQRRETVEEKIARHAKEGTKTTREVSVQFNADVADGMPWRFMPTQREVKVKPGESALAFFTAENLNSKPITGVSTYNVTPMKAAVYFNKVQCFCFEEQKLFPGEKIDMPVFFYIDPEFETDPKMNGINNLILSYTFFKVEDEGA